MPKFDRIVMDAPRVGALWVGCGEWGFRDLPMERHFELAKQFGFRILEIGIGGSRTGRLPTRMTDSEIAAFDALRKRFQIATPMCCIENDFTLASAAEHDAMVNETLEQLKLAARLGCQFVRLFAGFTPIEQMTEPIWMRMFDAFQKADAFCAPHGMTIAIETHGAIRFENGAAIHRHTVGSARAGLARLMRELPPRVGFNFDPGNLKAVEPNDRTFVLDLINDRINYCHLKDWKRTGPGWVACAIGDDDLDYARLLRSMKFSGCYLVEYEPTADIEDGIARSLAELKRIAVI